MLGELAAELLRFHPSRELFLLDGWLGSVLVAEELDDLGVSLLLVDDAPWAEDCCDDVGVPGDVALAAAEFAADGPPVDIEPLAVCVEFEGEEYDGPPGLWPGRGDPATDWSLMCFSTYNIYRYCNITDIQVY